MHDAAVTGGRLDKYFQSGFGMAEGVFNDDRQMFVAPAGERGFHYWYYERDGDHRFDFDGVVKRDQSLICRRTIARLTADRVAHTVAEYPGRDLYIVAVIGTTADSGVVERQRQALHLVFSDPPIPRSARDRNAATEDPPVTSPTRVGHLAPEPKHTKHVAPEYPKVAVEAAVEGVVTADVTIGIDGKVTDAKVVRSIPMLDAAALAAVRQWEFAPPLVNGRPRPIITTVAVTFVLPATAGVGGKGVRAALTRGVVTGDRYENPFFGVHLGWSTEWRAIPDAEHVQQGDSFGKLIQAIQAGRPLESFPAFPMVLLSPQPGGGAANSHASIMVMAQSLAGNTGRGAVQTVLLNLRQQVAAAQPESILGRRPSQDVSSQPFKRR